MLVFLFCLIAYSLFSNTQSISVSVMNEESLFIESLPEFYRIDLERSASNHPLSFPSLSPFTLKSNIPFELHISSSLEDMNFYINLKSQGSGQDYYLPLNQEHTLFLAPGSYIYDVNFVCERVPSKGFEKQCHIHFNLSAQ